MSEERTVIEAPTNVSLRQSGWFMLATGSLLLTFFVWIISLLQQQTTALQSAHWPFLLLGSAALFAYFGVFAIFGVRLALENQKWVCGEDYLERRSEILGFGWSVSYRASAWHLKCRSILGQTTYSLSPVETRILPALMPFFQTSNGRQCLELGRQLALATGWPLQLSDKVKPLEEWLEQGI